MLIGDTITMTQNGSTSPITCRSAGPPGRARKQRSRGPFRRRVSAAQFGHRSPYGSGHSTAAGIGVMTGVSGRSALVSVHSSVRC
jgi:hypothetical protein